eukprot:GHVQ01026009.1.p2 GENE.GHVQ01026009.1~~GHVQ01026009.1.p2  ORF type:complete len:215 (+),score=28.09 GHVQ01026009.1:2505-3149(+)
MKQEDWRKCVEDCRQALNCEERSVKAHYMLGKSLLHLGETEEGLRKLTKAKTLSSSTKSGYEEEITKAIRKARRVQWFNKAEEDKKDLDDFMTYITELLRQQRKEGIITENDLEKRLIQLKKLTEVAEKETHPGEIPDYLNCKITMGLMDDPVCTPSGQTYERRPLEDHLKKCSFDPITREPCYRSQLNPNRAIKEATLYFIERNPWAVDEDGD